MASVTSSVVLRFSNTQRERPTRNMVGEMTKPGTLISETVTLLVPANEPLVSSSTSSSPRLALRTTGSPPTLMLPRTRYPQSAKPVNTENVRIVDNKANKSNAAGVNDGCDHSPTKMTRGQ